LEGINSKRFKQTFAFDPTWALSLHHISLFVRTRRREHPMPAETVIGLFPDSQQGEEIVPMLANRGYGQRDVEKLGGHRAAFNADGPDMIDKLADLGVDQVTQLESMVEVASAGGLIIAARSPDSKKAGQLETLMREHGATQCVRAADTGWTV
jgi:hypothetical protein